MLTASIKKSAGLVSSGHRTFKLESYKFKIRKLHLQNVFSTFDKRRTELFDALQNKQPFLQQVNKVYNKQ